jgi:hypothetical protein
MTLSDYINRQVPEYYDWMYLDGYTPEQILHASTKQMYDNYTAKKEAEQDVYVPNITFKSVVKIIK